jgi:hypothetical protein
MYDFFEYIRKNEIEHSFRCNICDYSPSDTHIPVMGRSEWGISLAHLRFADIRFLVKQHNRFAESEPLVFYAVIVDPAGTRYACIGNEGGRPITSKFISDYFDKLSRENPVKYDVVYPFDKPEWWRNAPVVYREI